MLTKRQIEKLQKAQKLNRGADIKVSQSHVRNIAQGGSSLATTIAAFASKASPASKVLPGLATGVLSS